jgi:hypothetical protein
MHSPWLGMRDSNPRSWDQNPVPYRLANPQRESARENKFEFLIFGIRPTFGGPATSSLKTSFQEKVALRIATGNSHPDPGTRTQINGVPAKFYFVGHESLPLGQSPSSKRNCSVAILPTKQVCSAILATLQSLLLSKP